MNAARLVEYDIATGAHQVIAEDSQFDVESGLTNPKTNVLEVVTFVEQRTKYDFIGPKLKADYEALQKINHGDIAGLSRTLDDSK